MYSFLNVSNGQKVEFVEKLTKLQFEGFFNNIYCMMNFIRKERVSKLTYPTLQHYLRMLYTIMAIPRISDGESDKKGSNQHFL